MSTREANGTLTDEERADYYAKLREVAAEDMEAAGMVFADGENPYEKDWDVNFDWPDEAPDNMNAEVAAATLVIGQRDKRKGHFEGRLRQSTLKRQHFSGEAIKSMREAVGWEQMKEWTGLPDPFAYGSQQAVAGVGNSLGQYVPLWPGPVTRQLYWQDYWQMSAKSFEAYNHDPISWRCIHMKAEFSLGRGLECKVTRSRAPGKGQSHDRAQEVWDEFWTRNKMDQRMDTITRDYCWGGEQFLRYFKAGQRKLTIRSIDPATIYDLITDPEDIETVFAYHQQFQTAYQLYAPSGGTPSTGIAAPTGRTESGAITRYIIRQILPQEIDHYKANSSGYERRGRSDLFPALGWIKRLRDYLTSHVIRADMLSRICWDLEVAGNQSALSNIRSQLFPQGRAPAPGTVFGHNTAAKLSALAPPHTASGASRGDPILDALITMIADSVGLPKDWLGFGLQNTRAGALVATEPGSKSLEDLQGTVEGMINDSFIRVMTEARITDAELEVTFPSIASEDRQQKLDDLGTMEANSWLSKQTAATMAAKEIGITTYDFDDEQRLIAEEFAADEGDNGPRKVRRAVILATKRQAAKIDTTKEPSFEDEPPGLLVPEEGDQLPAPGSPDGTQRTVSGGGSHPTGVTRGGAPANENPISAAGARNIRKDSTNLRQSETTFTLTASELHWLLMRERQGPRRRPDDPNFATEAAEYREQAGANLAELVDAAQSTQTHKEPSV